MTTRVNLLDLAPSHKALEAELIAAATRVITTQRFVLGDEGKALEREVAELCEVPHAVGCASGSDALLLALMALDVDGESAVVTTPHSFFATAGAAARLGTHVDFVDVERDTMNLDPEALKAFFASCERGADGFLRGSRSGKPIKAVIAVDLFGRPCRYGAIEALCKENNVKLIEDAAQSIGAGAEGRRCGAFGDIATFSFYPTKNLGGAGDGGMIATRDEALAARVKCLRVHGQSPQGRYYHQEVGFNSRLDELQAALLRVKLPHLMGWNAQRRAHADAYDAAFAEVEGINPLARPSEGVTPIYHLYVVRAQRRDELKAHLAEQGIGSGVYYPLPLHLQQCFSSFGYKQGDMPVAEALSAEVLALPMYPELGEGRERVIEAVRAFYA